MDNNQKTSDSTFQSTETQAERRQLVESKFVSEKKARLQGAAAPKPLMSSTPVSISPTSVTSPFSEPVKSTPPSKLKGAELIPEGTVNERKKMHEKHIAQAAPTAPKQKTTMVDAFYSSLKSFAPNLLAISTRSDVTSKQMARAEKFLETPPSKTIENEDDLALLTAYCAALNSQYREEAKNKPSPEIVSRMNEIIAELKTQNNKSRNLRVLKGIAAEINSRFYSNQDIPFPSEHLPDAKFFERGYQNNPLHDEKAAKEHLPGLEYPSDHKAGLENLEQYTTNPMKMKPAQKLTDIYQDKEAGFEFEKPTSSEATVKKADLSHVVPKGYQDEDRSMSVIPKLLQRDKDSFKFKDTRRKKP